MNEEELTKMPKQTARDILNAIPGGRGYETRVEIALEVAMNTEWWRGFWAGRYHEGRAMPPGMSVSVLTPGMSVSAH